jgi:hypothetical protein
MIYGQKNVKEKFIIIVIIINIISSNTSRQAVKTYLTDIGLPFLGESGQSVNSNASIWRPV